MLDTRPTDDAAMTAALARIQSDSDAWAIQRGADKTREVTVTANLYRNDGSIDAVTATGIAPFEAAPTVGPISGLPGWTVVGQRYANGLRSTILKGSDPRYLSVGLLSMGEAAELARDLNAAVEGVSA